MLKTITLLTSSSNVNHNILSNTILKRDNITTPNDLFMTIITVVDVTSVASCSTIVTEFIREIVLVWYYSTVNCRRTLMLNNFSSFCSYAVGAYM